MDSGTAILVLILVASSVFGLNRLRTDGKVILHLPGHYVSPQALGHELGASASFIQFSSPYCQPCKATHSLIDSLIVGLPDVAHIDLQVADHLNMVNTLHIMRTPTTVLVDGKGLIKYRSEGLPRATELQDALNRIISAHS
ncbi:MAG: hypothetical protein F2839_02795 [Actinobacteria bacterium]|uniref:Unannotated protein n=1 Tax=freshwater metagenome TaxID=449393 RepID=A0A6J5Z4Z2_9ZZZZ|nr:hypothetical protein [Actinomycetota bacterium]